MSAPSQYLLGWQEKVTEAEGLLLPPHLRFKPSDARGFIHTFIGMDTLRLRDEGDEAQLIATTEMPDFPCHAYRDALAMSPAERAKIRAKMQTVFLAVDAKGKLDLLLPLDVLTNILSDTGTKPLFLPQATDPHFPLVIKALPRWKIDESITKVVPAYLLCSAIENWLRDSALSAKYHSAITSQRRRLIDTFNNNRKSPIAKVPRSADLVVLAKESHRCN